MIVGKTVTLRGLELTDVDELLVYWNDIQFMNYSGRITPMSREEGLEWIRRTWDERRQGEIYTFAISTNKSQKYIGNIRLKILNTVSKRGDISLGIFNPEFRDKGLGTEALELAIEFGFETLNLLSLELRVFSNNFRAIAVYKKLGFREIGVRRKADYINGEFLDDLMMDLLVEEWRIRKTLEV
ncbi:MAG: GNAT family N-acetyltransferase [Candidatus Heimdallarchaeota archaeon]|nr:MAG: GNAT family N-acetyltransferase [Candidatus Heimdallarchaeota archaeon]